MRSSLRVTFLFITAAASVLMIARVSGTEVTEAEHFTGSKNCRSCHEKFYELWAGSNHGLAMQPFTIEFANQKLTPQTQPIDIDANSYNIEITDSNGWVIEENENPKKRYKIEQVMGGKNVYYFLTPMARGRLQVLPIAFDVRKKIWFDTTKSMIRHFTHQHDRAIDWKHPALTFNTSCFGCHVSQLSTNYDLKTDTYKTKWAEPGINCETCHGPSSEHVRVYSEAAEGQTPKDLKLISTSNFTAEQKNAMCAPCHAKMHPLTTTFKPGDRYFDHYDLAAMENHDFYPDGRDLGENYTYTLWRMSPCVKSGKLDCMHCHTSSGRYKFSDEKNANNACMPCHRPHVQNTAAHTHHPEDSDANKCISCHMPMTEFARMNRSDHSMRSPMPALTVKFGSPNACNLCHTDKDAKWSDKWVRKWYRRDYQADVMHVAGLIDQARRRDFSRLPEMLKYITHKKRDDIYTTSLIRLLEACPDKSKDPIIRKALKDKSPLIRSAAVHSLAINPTEQNLHSLLKAAEDDYRLVRIQAAYGLSFYPLQLLSAKKYPNALKALTEYETSISNRPDDSYSHYNLGIYYANQNRLIDAVKEYELASKLLPDNILPLVNISLIHAALNDINSAEKSLRKALEIDPNSLEANYNLGLLMAEKGDIQQAQTALRTAMKTDPNIPEIAYNLAILIADEQPNEALEFCQKAHLLQPDEPKYIYSLAYYLLQAKHNSQAKELLTESVEKDIADSRIYQLLGEIYEIRAEPKKAIEVYKRAMKNKNLHSHHKNLFTEKIKALQDM